MNNKDNLEKGINITSGLILIIVLFIIMMVIYA